MLHDLGWPTLEERRPEQRSVLFYKIIHGISHVQTEGILAPADSRTRSNHRYKYGHIRKNCEVYRNSFFPATISRWNSLPAGTVEARAEIFLFFIKSFTEFHMCRLKVFWLPPTVAQGQITGTSMATLGPTVKFIGTLSSRRPLVAGTAYTSWHGRGC